MTYNNYLDVTADRFSDMHVNIEGAIALFENDTGPIVHLCTQKKELEARTAFNDIGSALYTLRGHMTRLQNAVYDESEHMHVARKENHDD